MKKLLSLILLLSLLFVCIAGCQKTNITNLSADEDIHTEYNGVYMTYKSTDTESDGHKVLNIVWHNETESDVIYGESFAIERKNGDVWEDITPKSINFIEIANLLEPRSTTPKAYSTEEFDLSQEELYRLVCSFSVANGSGYKTWVEFRVETQ